MTCMVEEVRLRAEIGEGVFSISQKKPVVKLLFQVADELTKVSLIYKETTGCTHIIRSMITVNNTTRDACNQNFP